MAQGALPFKYEEQLQGGGMTALAGLPVYLDLAPCDGAIEVSRKTPGSASKWSWVD